MSQTNNILDVRGLNCPQPVLRMRVRLKEMESGKVLQIVATDPGSIRDIKTYCNHTDDTLISSSETDGEYVFLIKKS